MTVGFIMMCHTALDRAAQVARFWSEGGSPVVIHVDARVTAHDYNGFKKMLADLENVSFSRRYKCEWGTWSLVAASQAAAEQMLALHADVRHVYLASGSCLPLRPLHELTDYLDARPYTDFIESVTTTEVGWTVGGIDIERFTLRFPFSWKKQRRMFDRYVEFQRRVGFKRRIPDGLVPHLGSQWWCLTRQTLSAILEDPDRALYDRYFKRVWIPDESYFQTLARLYSTSIESRSLTLTKFDFQGKPHIFYDDHLQLLRRSDCFVARKIWPKADKLYRTFLDKSPGRSVMAEPNPAKIDRLFSKSIERRTRGRPGLYMQSRFPRKDHENGKTSAPYSIFHGFSDLFENFDGWLAKYVGARVHGHLFAPERAEFAGGERMFNGCLTDDAALRDYNPRAFLTNLIWNSRGERQCYMFSPRDNQANNWFTATDPNAQISVITGAWALPLSRRNENFTTIRREAAMLQKRELEHLDILRSMYVKARVRIWTVADFIENPMEPLQTIIDEISPRATRRLTEAPQMVDLSGFNQFLQNLKNQGMQPLVMGDFPLEQSGQRDAVRRGRPYLVK
ncbi:MULTISPECIES: beta-1,6-N-acetylglucosaminyltransferase [Thioclava]|uniref:Peptide O-xylosyltransferase n=1 Tax=Thioclava nitratireducens TaxID=1915078 RepID=A0ABN4X2E3_9RHOB|nr:MULTISPECIES: beta-1,6-N-acetylglucosaminyltransferase [Thioclava]AQS46645.1 glycosyl transferase [Thioclava nitratireducens]OWY02207.1 glycosyl transferase [Thioclava sp. IC9]OWY02695.1 glycosyl transferase [Thioclava sp. F1Mire-8]OWY08357.1 glycosyl transferase [Thioclava sp. F42-5]